MKATTTNNSEITSEILSAHGLKQEDYQKILSIMGREPNLTELGIFSVMWSEHCSYKSTRLHLKKLPTKAHWVICGPGENAGIIDIGDDDAIIFKMESHNHPSFIEPYQGAATGVGGIMRDVFTMGARPVANLNSLRFGEINHPKTRYLVSGVVSGIGGYGNPVGVPTIMGDTLFHKSFNGNILVNAMCVGLANKNKIFYSAASNVGAKVVYVGSKTGRDGIHGATMASKEFDDKSEEQRPTVQVGDPFAEKLLIEACLELMQTDSILAIQDMGAAGLTSSSIEMTAKGGTGIELELDKVPMRETGMVPYEIMLSESQERMLMIIKPEKEKMAEEIFRKWDLDFAVIGKITDSKKLVLKMNDEIAAEIPVNPLSDEAPIYDRPHIPTPKRKEIAYSELKQDKDIVESLKTLLSCPDLVDKRWIYEQYDRMVMNNTISYTGNAGIIRIGDYNSKKAVAAKTDCTPRYVEADPFEGAKQAVAETYRNLVSVGAKPLAITNCLNFGSPERPEIMGQIVSSIEGIAEACRELDYPVVSGNVSLYNETSGVAVQPTPNIGGVGIINDISKIVNHQFKKEGEIILLVGQTKGHMGSTLYLREIEGREDGTPPAVNLKEEKKNADFISKLIDSKLLSACHDLSDGGLLIALSEMILASNIGASVNLKDNGENLPAFVYAFAEDQARYLISIEPKNLDKVLADAKVAGVNITQIGKSERDKLVVDGKVVSIEDLKKVNEGWVI